MSNDITALMATMKAAAEKATQGNWRAFQYRDGRCGIGGGHHAEIMVCEHISKERPHDAEFIALVNPANVKTLVEALEKAQQTANINNWWKPDVCPITGRGFFMWIEHPQMGMVPTYGGPFDSYTIPTRDSDGEFSCERYDHDVGDWVDGECVGAYLIDDDEQCRVYELEQNVSELREQLRTVELSNSVLESRSVTVKLPERHELQETSRNPYQSYMQVLPDEDGDWIRYDDVVVALAAAGIQVIEGEGQ